MREEESQGFGRMTVTADSGSSPEQTLTRDQTRFCYVDRELSWLQFNLRVLQEADDASVPLLERLKFLGIYHSNLTEFFMVRVGSLTHRAHLLPDETDEKTLWTPAEQLKRILRRVRELQETEERVYHHLLQDMKLAGIDVLDCRRLSKSEETMARKFFAELRPLLSPRIVDGIHPFPFIANGEICIAALLKNGEQTSVGLCSVYHVPLCRVFELEGRQKVLLTPDLIRHFTPLLFKKQDIRETVLFQVTRNADIFPDDELDETDGDFRSKMEKMLRKRKRQQPVRLLIDGKPGQKLLAALEHELRVPEKNVFYTRTPMELSFGSAVKKSPSMKYGERRPKKTVQLQKGEMIPYLLKQDILLAFPFQSMQPFVDLLYEAADDPCVRSIRITLYRLSASSKVAAALAYAADRGKEVLCLLELRARFDEQNNIDYSELLEDAGCQVIYGLPGMKVHSKLCLITRQAGDTLQYITQVGTGNYNESTSEQYTDLSLMTSRFEVGEDAAAVFDSLALGQVPKETNALWVAPLGFKPRFLEMVRSETEKGSEGHITVKVNSINDIEVMNALIDASRAGCRVELFVRGICCLRPGIPGFTDHLSVKSIVGRYLEHSRIFAFGAGEDCRIFIGSGDLLNRNTRRRVEAFIECVSADSRESVLHILDALRADHEKGSRMQPDASYRKEDYEPGTSSQDALYHWFAERVIHSERGSSRTPLTERIRNIVHRIIKA